MSKLVPQEISIIEVVKSIYFNANLLEFFVKKRIFLRFFANFLAHLHNHSCFCQKFVPQEISTIEVVKSSTLMQIY